MMQDRAHDALRFRMVTHVVSVQSHDVGDVAGHSISLTQFSGLAFFPDDGIATAYFTAMSDYRNGAGAFTLYPILTLDHGSVLWLKSVGTATIDGTKTQFVGTVTVLGGKGQFDGVAGDGMLTGTRYTPLSVGADLVSDYTVRIET
jgi:hypothetical protein